MAAIVKHEPLDIGDSSGTSEMLMMEGASVVMQEQQQHQQDLSSHHEQEQRNQQVQVEEDDDKLQMMQTDEDPLLQETINALMNGSGGLEAVSTVGVSDEIDNERNYECNFCGKLFTRSNTLSYHLKVHNDEKPYKCGSCDKAFREQYRLTKHQRTHTRDLAGGLQQHQDQEAEQSQDSSFPSTSGRTAEDEDYTTGDSERFFRNYELQEDSAVMKLEPDISLTVDGASSTNQATSSSNSDSDVRYQIVEERIKSLQREVHLVNQNLNRVETKLDGLTKIIAIFINKFEEVDPQANVASDSSAMIPIPMISVPIGNLQNLQPQPATVSVSQPQSQPQPTIQMITTHHQAAPPMATTVTVQPSPSIQHQPAQQGQLDNSSFIGGLSAAAVAAVANNLGAQPVAQQQTTTTTIYSSNNDTFPEVPELPIRTVNDFLDLNDHCTDNDQFLLQMMIRLHQEVDNSQPRQRNIKKMMEALVTYEVLCQFSWSGKSAINGQYTKYVFGNSVGIIDLLTKTLNLGKSAEEAEANRKPIFTAIQSFIKHSRQNMLRDSRKRRDSNNSVYPVHPGPVHCGADRQLKQQQQIPQHHQIKLEQQDIVNQYYD